MNAVERFVDAVNRGDLSGVEAAFHPDFEMIVPQHPARGFRGRDQEVENMRRLMTNHPDARIRIHRMVVQGAEVWVQNTFEGKGIEMAAAVIYEIDPGTDTIIAGHYYSEPVDRGDQEINSWIDGLSSSSARVSRNRETYQRLLAGAEVQHDLTSDRSQRAMLEAFAPDYELVEPPSLPHGGTYKGREEWLAMHEKMGSLWSQKVTPVHIWDVPDADLIVLYSEMEWTARQTGRTLRFPAVELLHFRDGLIRKVEIFMQDTKAVLDTLEPG